MGIIDDEENGYVVPVGSVQALAERIRYLYNSSETLQSLNENTKNKLENELSHRRTVDNYIAYFKSLVS